MKEYTVQVYEDKTEWYYNDKLHREDGPAVEYADGSKLWFLNGKRHRKNGPAIEWSNGSKHWFLNGELHRIDGPACEYANGNKYWYLNGEQVKEEEIMNKSEKVYTVEDLNNMTLEEIFNIIGKKS